MPPWARAAVDVLGELDAAGQYAYPIVVVLVPRQSAKTTTALDVALGRALVHRDYRAAYAAQTGHVTTERMGDRFTELAASMLSDRVRPRLSQGTERFTVRSTGSYCKAFPPKNGALRSSALDLVIVDEAQEHDDATLGVALDHTIMPTFTTRPRRQFLILGTAPDRPGTYLERYAQLARAGAPGVALIDYGATPDEDPADPAVWHRRHPGLAAGLTDEAFLRSQYELDPAGFAREHLNVWPDGDVTGSLIDARTWSALLDPDAAPGGRSLAFGVETSHDRSTTTLAAVSIDDAGRTVAEVVEHLPGIEWLPARWRELRQTYRARLFADQLGPTSAAVDLLTRERLPVELLTTSQYATACASVLADVMAGRFAHRGQPVLDGSALTATSRDVGDRWVWQRKGAGNAAPMIAVTVAAHGARAPRALPSVTVAAG